MKTQLLATALLLVSAVALAGSPTPGGTTKHIDKLEILLDLDAYQKQEVQKILDAQREQRQAKRKEMRESQAARPSREQMQQEQEAAKQATRAQLEKLLSEQQLKKFDVLTERRPMRRKPQGDRASQ